MTTIQTDTVEIIANYSHVPPFVRAQCKGTDLRTIMLHEAGHDFDGGTITIRVGGPDGAEYSVTDWYAYIEGDVATITPMGVKA